MGLNVKKKKSVTFNFVMTISQAVLEKFGLI